MLSLDPQINYSVFAAICVRILRSFLWARGQNVSSRYTYIMSFQGRSTFCPAEQKSKSFLHY